MSFTEEQTAIVAAAQNTSDNLAIVARAGTGKTFTLIQIAKALPDTKILCLAFNKAIALEMRERLPDNCESKTLHSIGFAAWRGFIRTSTTLNKSKVFDLVRAEIEVREPELDPEEVKELWSHSGDLMRAVASGKNTGWLPESYSGHWRPLCDDFGFFDSLELEFSPIEQEIIKAVSIDSFKQALKGHLDFDDMIFCPAICSVQWPSVELLLVDEAQDLAPINHHIIRKIVRKNRIIAVGDPFQAIYGFRGASTTSMEKLINMFRMEILKLTATFRCAPEIVENAKWRAFDLRAFFTDKKGSVHRLTTWAADDIQDGDAIICRNNAPLFRMAIRLIKAGRAPNLSGRDVGVALKKIMQKLSRDKKIPRAEIVPLLAKWRDKELDRAKDGAEGRVHDYYSCMLVIVRQTETLADAMAYLDHLVNREGRIHLMTGHKAKGLEFSRVFFLDPKLCNPKYDQDLNLKYVIETRAERWLAYVTTDTFQQELEEDGV